jgi:hypothetical protein
MAGTSYSSDKYYLIFFRPRYATQDFLPFREPLALAVDSADQGVELFLRGSELAACLLVLIRSDWEEDVAIGDS